MESKYTVLGTFKQREWLVYCPIKVEKGQLVLDNSKNDVLLQIKMLNLSFKNLKSVYIDVNILDDNGEIFCIKEDIAYLGLNIKPKSYFGEKTPIYLNSTKYLNVKIIINKVIFNDDSIWINREKSIGVLLPEQKPILKSDKLYDQIQREFKGTNGLYLFYYEKYSNYWRCSCGTANPTEYKKCLYCNIDEHWLEVHLNTDYLMKKDQEHNKIQESIKKEKEESLRKKQEDELKEKAIKKFRKKKRIKILAILCSIAIIIYIISFTIIKIYTAEPLTQIVSEDNKSKIEKVLKLGKDVNEVDENNRTALGVAVNEGNKDSVDILLNNGADVNLKSEGKLPLEIAIEKGHEDIIKALLNKNAEVIITETKNISVSENYGGQSIYLETRGKTINVEAKVEITYKKNSTFTIYFGDYKYKGDFKDGSITGEGSLYNSKNNALIYSGEFKDGLYNGEGKIYWGGYGKVFLDATFKNGNAIKYTRYYMDGELNDLGTADGNGTVVSNKYGTEKW